MTDRVIDLLDPETHADNPWPLYEWMREEAPLYFDAENGVWCVSRYDDIIRVARDPKTFTSVEGNRPNLPYDGSFIHLDGKGHHERRNLLKERFGPTGIKRIEGHIRDVCVELIERVLDQGECEFIEDIAAPLPTQIIAEMTGIPKDQHDTVRHHLDIFCKGGNGPKHVTDEVNTAFYAWAEIHFNQVMERMVEPKDDVLSLWIQSTDLKHAPFDEENLLFEHTMLMVGGSETTRNAISGGLYELIQHPEQLAWLEQNPQGIPNAVEEMLRWSTPFVSMSRTATKDVEWYDQTIKEGQEIMMLYPAGNRDPSKFTDPYTFDIHREFTSQSLSFGYGPHFCLGARLARAEARILLEEIFGRMDNLHITQEPVLSRSSFIRGIKSMGLGFSRRQRMASK